VVDPLSTLFLLRDATSDDIIWSCRENRKILACCLAFWSLCGVGLLTLADYARAVHAED
jgi:hypothetical protein